MAQYIKNAPLLSRVGEGFGRGLSESLPQELDRYRLSSGLKAFEQDSANLNPMQQLARLSAIPGITPQMVQSFSELARQQGMAKALEKQAGAGTEKGPYDKGSKFFGAESPSASAKPLPPTMTNKDFYALAQKGYIPPTQQERDAMASQLFEQNPARYKNDPQKAIDAVDRSVAIENERYKNALQVIGSQGKLQEEVKEKLEKQSKKLNVDIPSNVYSSIEDDAIRSVLPKDMGGKGLTADQAMKHYADSLDSVSRQYNDIDSIGDWGVLGRSSSSTLGTIKSLQKRFEERNDTENFADRMIAKQKISPMLAYSLAEPVNREPALNRELKALKPIKQGIIAIPRHGAARMTTGKEVADKTLAISPKLMQSLGEKGSPLAVAYELQKKGYDPQVWLDYLRSHEKEWNPHIKQLRQISKQNPTVGTLNDWWLSSFTGIE